jgi:ubiquinone/menaquinone biosynthesis C-methylase UbiE
VLDYSQYLIDCARKRATRHNYQIDFIQADARSTGLPPESFDHVLIMGNSLGYASEPAADKRILAEARRVLRSGGWLLIDVTNAAAVKDSFNPTAWHEVGTDVVVCRQREMAGSTVHAREIVLSKKKGLLRDRTYSIRLYKSQTLGTLLEKAGFIGVYVHTDFSPHEHQGDYGFMNHRMLARGQRP